MITREMLEQAKKKGIDVSWAEGIQAPVQAPVQATGGAERLSLGAQQLMDVVKQAQARTPVYMPFAPGTPTQARRQAEEQKRQFDVEQALREREFAADEAYRQAQLALQRLKAVGSVGTGTIPGTKEDFAAYLRDLSQRANVPAVWNIANPPEAVRQQMRLDLSPEERYPGATPAQARKASAYEEVVYNVQQAVSEGDTWDEIKRTLKAAESNLIATGITYDQALKWAYDAFEQTVTQILQGQLPVQVAGGFPYRSAGAVLNKAKYQAELQKARSEMGKNETGSENE